MLEEADDRRGAARAKDALARSLPGAFETSANAVGSFANVFIYDLGLDYYSQYAAAGAAVTASRRRRWPRSICVPDSMVVSPSATGKTSSRSCRS